MRDRRRTGTATATAAAAALVGAVAVAGGPGVSSAEGARAATAAERPGIVAAARATTPRADRAKFRVTGVRVSTLSRNWATAVIAPTARYRDRLEGAYTILVRSAISQRWLAVDLGSSGVACGIAPVRVLRDLGRGGECPPKERL